MLQLKHLHGLKQVFAVASTYNEWRLFWLDADDFAKAQTISELLNLHEAEMDVDTSALEKMTIDSKIESDDEDAVTVDNDKESTEDDNEIDDDEDEDEKTAVSGIEDNQSDPSMEKEVIKASIVYTFDSPNIVQFLLSIITKMSYITRNRPSIFNSVGKASSSCKYGLATEETFVWRLLPKEFTTSLQFKGNCR